MKLMCFLAVAVLGLCQAANAGIAFKLSPNNQSAYAGTTLNFTLTLASDQAVGNNVNNVEFNVVAGSGTGAQGVFVSPTNQTTNILPFGGPADYTSTPGQVFVNANNSSTNVPVSQTGFVLANLFLDTTGVTAGNYTLSLTDLAANDGVSGALAVSGPSINYQILSAVPEPTSILTASSLALGAVFYRRRRAKVTKSKNASVKA